MPLRNYSLTHIFDVVEITVHWTTDQSHLAGLLAVHMWSSLFALFFCAVYSCQSQLSVSQLSTEWHIVTDVLTLFSGDLLRWVLSEGGRHVVVWRGINQRQFVSFCEYQHLSVKVYSKLVSKNICISPEINVQWLTAKSISLSVTLSVCLSVCNCMLQWLHC